MQFSVRDQGDLAKTELRLSIITILHKLMNILNYTAGNIFCLPRGKSGGFFPLIWETLTFRTVWFLVFSCFIWDCLRVKFGFLFQIFQCISLLMHISCPSGTQKTIQNTKMSQYTEGCILHFWKIKIVLLHCSLP